VSRHCHQQAAPQCESCVRSSSSGPVVDPAGASGTPRYLAYQVDPRALASPGARADETEARHWADRAGGTLRPGGHGVSEHSLFHASVRAAQRGLPAGARLSESDRSRYQTEVGEDLSDVRLHTDASSGAVADAIGANAYTLGRDIYFGRGKYQPGTPAGERLLRHEMAHASQHGAANRTSLHADLAMSLPTGGSGAFTIDMADRVAPATPGLEGRITFDPDPGGPYSAEIGLIQAAQIIDVSGVRSAPGEPWQFRTPGNVNRNTLGTTGASGEERGWHVDTTYEDPTKTQSSAVSPSYPQSVGLRPGNNEHGWLRSPTDTHRAMLYDYPGFAGPDLDYKFETVAQGMDNQMVYGSLHWGFSLRSGVPTAEFVTASAGTSAEFDISLQRFRAFFTHEPTIIYFDTDIDVPAAGEDVKLDEAMTWLTGFSDAHVEITGFADERGTPGHNARLSARRARSVASALTARGLAAARIDGVSGSGATTTFAAGTEAGQLKANRRVQIRFIRNASTPPSP